MTAVKPPLFLILTGATANAESFIASQELAREHWPGADVRMPNYLSRFRGVGGVGRWLDRWTMRVLAGGEPVYVLAYILGGAALPYAPLLRTLIKKIVLVRSRYQEAIPRMLRTRLGPWGTTLLFGKSVADLGKGQFWPSGFQVPCPTLILVETKPTRLARRLKVAALTDDALQIAAYTELPIDHDFAYHSSLLIRTATDWLRGPPA